MQELTALSAILGVFMTGGGAVLSIAVKWVLRMQSRSIRQSKAMLLLATLLDDDIRRRHPLDPSGSLHNKMKGVLEDQEGNL